MKVVFLSNFLNHHQLPFCLEMYKKLGNGFSFVATTSLPQEQLKLGYHDLNNEYPFLVRTYEGEDQESKAMLLTQEADVVIIGSASLHYVEQRLRQNKLTFYYSERLYKSRPQLWKMPVRIIKFLKRFGKYKNFHLLCASAFAARDFALTGVFINKAYKWGYFPEVREYDNVDGFIEKKNPNSMVWAGRFIEWKHPDDVIHLAKRLKRDGYDFCINMIGNGELFDSIDKAIKEHALEDRVQLLGAMPPEEVRLCMEQAEIHLFTSDRNEGWGAVLNESMNSGCAVVAGDAAGSVPFLIHDNQNGLIYKSENVDSLYKKVKYLLDNPNQRRAMGKRAYETMTDMWNAEKAAERIITLSEALLREEKHPDLFEEGPCSQAKILTPKHS